MVLWNIFWKLLFSYLPQNQDSDLSIHWGSFWEEMRIIFLAEGEGVCPIFCPSLPPDQFGRFRLNSLGLAVPFWPLQVALAE